jgi:hypothetical protein
MLEPPSSQTCTLENEPGATPARLDAPNDNWQRGVAIFEHEQHAVRRA